jgi:putative transposase
MPMDRTESLSHSKWECECHVVFVLTRRRKTLHSQLRISAMSITRFGPKRSAKAHESGHAFRSMAITA